MRTGRSAYGDPFSRKLWIFFLAFFSFLGITLGLHFANISSPIFSFLMRKAAYAPVSIVGLAFVLLLPFLFTAIVLWLSKDVLLLPFCFFETFLYALSVCSVHYAFGSAGWLVCSLLLFSDTVTIFTLYWFWIRQICSLRRPVFIEFIVCIAVCLMTAIIDHLAISPFLIKLMTS